MRICAFSLQVAGLERRKLSGASFRQCVILFNSQNKPQQSKAAGGLLELSSML
jgi:hypothetical protein